MMFGLGVGVILTVAFVGGLKLLEWIARTTDEANERENTDVFMWEMEIARGDDT